MKEIAIIRGGLAAALSVAAAACSTAVNDKPDLNVRPLMQQTGDNVPADAIFYQEAVSAIDHRDYATALDYLQAARAKDPKNVRVLNAFGVVYDKLGRFDLSTRYYTEAGALDPGSPTIARNIAYSRMLQGIMDPQLAANQPPAATPPVQVATLSSMTAEAGAQPIAAPTIPVTVQPITFEAAAHVPPALDPSTLIAPVLAPSALTFAGVNMELPDEPQAPALQPMRVEPSALTVTAQMAPQPSYAPVVIRPTVSFSNVAFALTNVPPVPLFVESPPADAAVPVVPELPRIPIKPIATPALGGLTVASFEIDSIARTVPAVYRVPAAPQPTPSLPAAAKKALLVGRPLRIVNAAGRQGVTEPVQHSLSALGWSVSKLRPTSAAELKFTTVTYPLVNLRVAQALARTLPFPARLQPDVCGCHGVQLVLGSDFLSWKATGRRIPNIWRTNLNFAALSANKGVQ